MAKVQLEIEDLRLMQRSNEESQIRGRLRYYDGSVLEFREAFVQVEPAEPPDLSEVLREIGGILYPQQRNDEGV